MVSIELKIRGVLNKIYVYLGVHIDLFYGIKKKKTKK